MERFSYVRTILHVSPSPLRWPFSHLPQQDLLGNAAVELLHRYLESQKRVLGILDPMSGLSSKHSHTEMLEFLIVWPCCDWQSKVYFRKGLTASQTPSERELCRWQAEAIVKRVY